jgi:hypothetical protein
VEHNFWHFGVAKKNAGPGLVFPSETKSLGTLASRPSEKTMLFKHGFDGLARIQAVVF